MKNLILLPLALVLIVSLTACSQPDQATSILQNQGYTNIQIEGYDPFGCSEDDVYRTKFSASKGQGRINGVVCAGAFKGATIRLYN